MTSPPETDFPGGLTRNAFLGGRLEIAQPVAGYRAGVDPVLLAAACPARAGESVLELGCGAGVAVLCLGARVSGLTLAGLELQPAYAALARENAGANGLALEVVEGDLSRMPAELKARSFHQVIANPPYFDRSAGTMAPDAGRETALGEATPLGDWVAAAARRLRPGGWLTLIHRAERLDALLVALAGTDLGAVRLLPLAPRAGRDTHLVLMRARKGGRAPLRLHAPLVLHAGDRHERDGEDYAPEVGKVLRHGAALAFPE